MYKCDTCGRDTENSKDFFSHIDGKVLFTNHRCDDCEKRIEAEIDFQMQGETIRETELLCPWCGHEYGMYDAYGFDEGETEKIECELCGRKFDLEIETRRLFSTKRSLCEMGKEPEE